MERKHNQSLVSAARVLRKNMTKEERRLWYEFLRSYPLHFTRQKILGRYIADFYCAKAKLVIELDGSQHYQPEGQMGDQKRTSFLSQYGLTVLRIPNNEINQHFASVCQWIDMEIRRRVDL